LKKIKFLFLIKIFLLISCGLENYVYLEPVERITIHGTNSISAWLPSGQPSEFRSYTVFYRIYISDFSINAIPSDIQRVQINPALASHFNTIDPYTTNDSVSPNAISSVFSNLRYYPLYISKDRINEYHLSLVLDRTANTLDIDFTSSSMGPQMIVNSNTSDINYLFRTGGSFSLHPDRLFFHSSDLIDENNLTGERNTDVERNGNLSGASSLFTYVSMYILASGIDGNYSPIYSRPKHIGIFRLP